MKNGVYQILHVEDNEAQLENCELALTGAFSRVGKSIEIIGAKNTEEAESRIVRHKKELDLIILDIDLGTKESRNGLDLISEISDINPSIPIFVLSTNVDRYRGALNKMKAEQMICGYSEPVNKPQEEPWPKLILRILEGRQVNILHLSDIHEGKFFAYDKLVLNKPAVLADFCSHVDKVDFVVVSGDLSSDNSEEDYNKALSLLDKIKDHLRLQNSQFVFAPGNHDQDWDAEDPRDTKFLSGYLSFINRFYASAPLEDCILDYPAESLADDYTSQQSILDNLISICAYPAQKTVVVSMCSISPRDKRNKKSKTCWAEEDPAAVCGLLCGGEISTDQLLNVKNKLKELFLSHPETEKYARVAVFHHNIFEPSHVERSSWCPTILNEGNLMKFLSDYGFRFVLHGHLHHAENYMFSVGSGKPGISVISTGTLSGNSSMDKSFCANKISYFVDGQGKVSEAKLTKFTLPNDDYQWKTETVPIRYFDE